MDQSKRGPRAGDAEVVDTASIPAGIASGAAERNSEGGEMAERDAEGGERAEKAERAAEKGAEAAGGESGAADELRARVGRRMAKKIKKVVAAGKGDAKHYYDVYGAQVGARRVGKGGEGGGGGRESRERDRGQVREGGGVGLADARMYGCSQACSSNSNRPLPPPESPPPTNPSRWVSFRLPERTPTVSLLSPVSPFPVPPITPRPFSPFPPYSPLFPLPPPPPLPPQARAELELRPPMAKGAEQRAKPLSFTVSASGVEGFRGEG
ncbi:unnamed protein product [Closterium sp. NIES-54]